MVLHSCVHPSRAFILSCARRVRRKGGEMMRGVEAESINFWH